MSMYIIYSYSNDSYAFRKRPTAWTKNEKAYEIYQELTPDLSGVSLAGVRRCEACGAILSKWQEPLNGLQIKKRHFDISSTYDGVRIVSKRFKEVVQSNALTGIKFTLLPNDEDFYSIHATHVVQLDPERSMLRFENQCAICGIYESVVGPYTVLRSGEKIPVRGFARTDLEFASEDERHPLLLCGQEAADVLSAANLKGLELHAVVSQNSH